MLVTPLPDGKTWIILSDFGYEVGAEGSGDIITVPIGTHTDFASIPRLLWAIFPRWGKYGNAAVIHDWLYWEQSRGRKNADLIMLEAMGVLSVPAWQKYPIFWAIRLFGWFAWWRNENNLELEKRRSRVRQRRKIILWSSLGCLLFVPIWGFLRVFFCWEGSCSGIICVLCELHLVITGLLVVFMAALVLMAHELMRVSIESPENLPESADDPWVPGTKHVVKGVQNVSQGVRNLAKRATSVPGAESIATAIDVVASGASAIPGAKAVKSTAKLVKDGAVHVVEAGREFEHGRSLVGEDRPQGWTLAFTLIALGLALFMILGPFNIFFF